jgi:hypothetical protein
MNAAHHDFGSRVEVTAPYIGKHVIPPTRTSNHPIALTERLASADIE